MMQWYIPSLPLSQTTHLTLWLLKHNLYKFLYFLSSEVFWPLLLQKSIKTLSSINIADANHYKSNSFEIERLYYITC